MNCRALPCLAALLVTALAQPATAAPPPVEPGAAVEPETDACRAVMGDARQHERNRRVRRENLVLIEPSDEIDDEIVIVHKDPKLQTPESLRVEGIRIAGVEELDEEDFVLVLDLDEPLASACGAEQLRLSVDDSLGRRHQIAWVGEQGAVLLEDRETLVWVGVDNESPSFQMVWRSTFSVDVVAQTAKKPAKKRAKRKKPRKRKKRR